MDFSQFMIPSPINGVTLRALSSIRRFWPRRQLHAMCNASRLSSTPCDNEGCSWASMLLQMIIPPAHGRTARNPTDAVLDEFFSVEPAEDRARSLPFTTVHPAVDRIVAIGDVHGDINAMRSALRNASVIDDKDEWIGGRAVLVQVGDQLDRGSDEREIYNLLFSLQDKAPGDGGAVHILLGNHELMNTRLDFRYVSRGGFNDFDRDGGVSTVFGKPFQPRVSVSRLKAIRMLPSKMRARARSVVAGGPLAAELAQRARVSVVVGDSLFVHGGLSTKHLKFGGRDERDAVTMLEDLNLDTRRFLEGKGTYPTVLHGGDSPVWMRDYSRPRIRQGGPECRMLADTLRLVGAKRMVVGHTPQAGGINAACGARVWRIDTGMSKAYGGVPEAIEISKRGNVRIYTPNGPVQGSARCN